jgi:hypothetical protein
MPRSGCGLRHPLATVIPSLNLDFYINLGDVIYETASNVKGSIGQPYTNSTLMKLKVFLPCRTLHHAFCTEHFYNVFQEFVPVS